MRANYNSKAIRNVPRNITFSKVRKRFKFVWNSFSVLSLYPTRSWKHSKKKEDIYGNPSPKVTHQPSTTIPIVLLQKFREHIESFPNSRIPLLQIFGQKYFCTENVQAVSIAGNLPGPKSDLCTEFDVKPQNTKTDLSAKKHVDNKDEAANLRQVVKVNNS
ncbi:unnamed protein product [Lepeophtheirus salmonis]|uniref:(salmon louse) hypothetical protein n=1 Tax=Lepeophtheirus salmonis TaxID=72036 RepID=A0A7R8D7E3_LEPSM|nr:unnamed protein product [Lepeophtheirus salmonis]CAF2999327.1 unnamed protein product [Lepeophtheirus salmonis]